MSSLSGVLLLNSVSIIDRMWCACECMVIEGDLTWWTNVCIEKYCDESCAGDWMPSQEPGSSHQQMSWNGVQARGELHAV